MIDTVRIKYNRSDYGTSFIDHILDLGLLENLSERNDKKFNYRMSGTYKNLNVTFSESYLMITGSLNKYWYHSNVGVFTHTDFTNAIAQLSEDFQVNLFNALLLRIDIAATLRVKYPVKCYLNSFTRKEKTERKPYENGVYFSNTSREIVFYDKVLETNKRRQTIPEEYADSHLLRYELRFKKKIANSLKNGESYVLVSDLCDYKFHVKLLQWWLKEFKAIAQEKQILLDPSCGITQVKDFQAQLMLLGIKAMGGFAKLNDNLQLISDNKGFDNATQKMRLNKVVKSLGEKKDFVIEGEILDEINSTVIDFYCAYMFDLTMEGVIENLNYGLKK